MAAIDDALHCYIGERPGTMGVLDSSADALHGAIVAGVGAQPQWLEISGRQVLHFPQASNIAGSTAGKSRVVIPGGWPLAQSFSVALWVRRDEFNSGVTSCLIRNGGVYNGAGWWIDVDANGRFRFSGEADNGSADTVYASNSTPSGSWVALIVTYDELTRTPKIFLDGTEADYFSGQGPSDFSANVSDARLLTSSDLETYGWAFLGHQGHSSSNHWNTGGAYEVAVVGPVIWDRVLTSTEITEMVALPDVPESGGGEPAIIGFPKNRIVNR